MVAPQIVLRPLTADEHTVLTRIAHASSERLDRVRRARALLAVASGISFAQAAREAGFRSGSAVTALVGRFNTQGLAALTIAAGRGRKPTYGAAARTQIVTIAQTAPQRRHDGTATWSLGTSTIRRILQAAGSSYQRTRSWCPTGTAQRARKSGVVTVVDPQREEKRG